MERFGSVVDFYFESVSCLSATDFWAHIPSKPGMRIEQLFRFIARNPIGADAGKRVGRNLLVARVVNIGDIR